jgi:FolB domain-containing protein
MIAEIIIDELSVKTIIGCNPEERISPQILTISLAIQYDIKKASATDNIDYSVNYSDLCNKIKRFVENSEFNLIEALAESVVSIVFSYSQVLQVSLFIYKPDAIDYTKRVGLKLTRKKESQTTNSHKELTW